MTMSNLTGDKPALGLLKTRPDIPILLCTGYSNRISEETALQIGIEAFACKAVDRECLGKIVRKVLDGAGHSNPR